MSLYSLLADLIVFVHAIWVCVVVFGLAAILLGAALGWGWIRSFWPRVIHLGMIGLVVFESLVGLPCPLTVWETDLRRAAGQEVAEGTFVGRIVHDAIYFEAPPWAFTVLYCAFGSTVLATMIFLPPRWPKRSRSKITPRR